MPAQVGNRFSALLLEGLDHYRKGRMLEAVRAWEEAYLLEPSNLRAREFLRSALERIPPHPWLPPQRPLASTPAAAPASAPAPARKPAGATPGPAKKPASAAKPAAAPEKKPAAAALPRSPWDDGPSLAIPQPEVTGEGGNAAWSIHKDKVPAESAPDDETQVWMRGARELVALNDFSGALELLNKVLDRKPDDADAQKLHASCEHNLTLMFESKIGSMDARPRTAIPPDEIIWLNLDPRAGFVLAQIDGEVSFDDLYAICGLKRLDTARILCELLEQGVVRVEGRGQAVAKRAVPRS